MITKLFCLLLIAYLVVLLADSPLLWFVGCIVLIASVRFVFDRS